MSHVKNIAIVGGSGQAGSPIVQALIASGKFTVTAITRTESSSTFPPAVKVQRGDENSDEFLEAALKYQDVLIIILGTRAPKDVQTRFITAAAAADVPWILPCEFGPDTGNPDMVSGVSILSSKKQYRDHIESLGKSNWIGFINGLWFDYSLVGGFFGIKIKERTARMYDDGTTKLSTSTLPQVGRAVAKLFELPVEKLQQFKNSFVYVHSFHVSQVDMLNSVMRATKSSKEEWEIMKVPVDEAIAQGNEMVKMGNYMGMLDVLYGSNLKPGMGGDYAHKSDNKVLGLEEEDLDEVVDRIIEGIEAK